jgi:hypothetical protein
MPELMLSVCGGNMAEPNPTSVDANGAAFDILWRNFLTFCSPVRF